MEEIYTKCVGEFVSRRHDSTDVIESHSILGKATLPVRMVGHSPTAQWNVNRLFDNIDNIWLSDNVESLERWVLSCNNVEVASGDHSSLQSFKLNLVPLYTTATLDLFFKVSNLDVLYSTVVLVFIGSIYSEELRAPKYGQPVYQPLKNFCRNSLEFKLPK